jgi:general L-amino acid transport system permease protein
MDTLAVSAPPPKPGLFERARAHLFYSPAAGLVTFTIAALLLWALWRSFGWGVLHAVAAPDFAACKAADHGACWGFVAEKWRLILFGRYPYEQQWRPALATGTVLAMLVASALPAFWTRRGARALAAGWLIAFAVFFTLMRGDVFGLESVGTERWGGLPLTVILTLIGITASAPIGVLLALARRSSMPISSWYAACR